MMIATQTETIWHKLITFIRSELKPYPERGNLMLRLLLTSTIVIIVSQTLQIPMLSVSLISVVYVLQSNTVLTQIVAVACVLSTLLAIGTGLFLLKYTFDYPLLRILGASSIVFISLYLMRVFKLGIIFLVVALVVIYLQSVIDSIGGSPEVLFRLVLWSWIAGFYPICLALLVNSFFLPSDPQKQLYDALIRQLDAIHVQLGSVIDPSIIAPRISTEEVEHSVLELHKLLSFATLKDKTLKAYKVQAIAYISMIDRLYTAAAELSRKGLTAPLNLDELNTLCTIRAACESLKETVRNGPPFKIPSIDQKLVITGEAATVLLKMQSALNQGALSATLPEAEKTESKTSLFVSDIRTNPNYIRFALKTLLATLLGYLFYTAVQWEGIHTIMLTSIVIALPSLGATSHKSLLRITGCLIGSALALFSVIFIMPYLESIVGLLLLCLPVFALGAWIIAGSERSNYIGVQIILCFSLALLDAFGPTTSVTEIRDRLIGILLGVAITTVIYAYIWPEKEGGNLRKNLVEIVQAVSSFLNTGNQASSLTEKHDLIDQARLQVWSLIGKSETMLANISLEPSWRYRDHEILTLKAQTFVAQMREILLLINNLQILREQSDALMGDSIKASLDTFSQAAAEIFEYMKKILEDSSSQALSSTELSSLCKQTDAIIIQIQNSAQSDQIPLVESLISILTGLNQQISQALLLLSNDQKNWSQLPEISSAGILS